jgi:hypothetical protein
MSKTNDKLIQLAQSEGYHSIDNFLRDYMLESIVPCICMNESCDHTEYMEPDQTRGHCDHCKTKSMKSCLML